MKPARFDYVAPRSVAEALAVLCQAGDEGKVLAGGQSLMPLLNFRMVRPAVLVDINGLGELAGLQVRDGQLAVGALTRHWQLERQHLHPLLAEAARHIGHAAIRSRGTIGGSLVHADPAAELALVATALDAEITLASAAGERTVRAGEFFLTYFTTAIDTDELLTEVRFPLLAPGEGWSFREISRRHGDFALVAVAATVTLAPDGTIASVRAAVAGGGGAPRRMDAAMQALTGRPAAEQALRDAVETAVAALEPESDLHATAAFRRHLARHLLREALQEAIARCQGGYHG